MVRVGAVCAALVGMAAIAVEFSGPRPAPSSPSRPSNPASGPTAAASGQPEAVQSLARHVAPEPTAGPLETIPPLPADAVTVPDADLLKLAGMVNLANARYQPADRGRWEQAVPAARRLLEGPCDCEQRNWLNHFVQMGGHALADAPAQYRDLAETMVTLARNDQEAMEKHRQANP